MEIRHLRYFVAVAEEKHFGRAAARLHVAQPPLSQQVRRLEAELGVELFYRTTRRVELSPAGEVLLERARPMIAMADLAGQDCRRAQAGSLGRLSLGFTGSTTYALLPAVVTALREGLPSVKLDLHGEMITPAQVQGLKEGTVDVGLLRPPVRSRELAVEVIRSEPLIAILPASHRLSHREEVDVTQLADDAFVAYAAHLRSVLRDTVDDACGAVGFTPRVETEVTETATLVSFVAAGLGVSLVPASVAQMTVAGAVYRPLAGVPPRVQLAIAHRGGDQPPLLARALELIRSAVRMAPTDILISKTSQSRTN